MKYGTFIKQQIQEYCEEEFPNEACGLVVEINNDYEVINCKNQSKTPKFHFIISYFDTMEAKKRGKIVAYFHSHPSKNAEFGKIDTLIAKHHHLDSILYCGDGKFLENE